MNKEVTTGAWEDLRQKQGSWAAALLMSMALVLPFAPGVAWPLGALALVLLLVRLIQGRGGLRWRWPCVGEPAFWATVFYLLHVIGMAWSSNAGFGLFDLDIKSPLLVFALLVCVAPPNQRGREGLLFAFVMGCVGAVLIHTGAAAFRVINDRTLSVAQEFYSSAFTRPMHPSYFALYLCVAIAAWYLTNIHSVVKAWQDLLMFAVLCLGVLLSGSKAGWIVVVLLLPTLLVLKWRTTRIRNVLLSSIAFTSVGMGSLVAFSPNARERVQEAWHAAFEEEHKADASASSEVRWVTWSAALHVFRAHPLFGTGTGDIKDELVKVYAERGNTYAFERKFNAHDQFLQSAACLGVPGLVALLGLVLVPVLRARRSGALAVIVALIWLVNLAVESMLEVQAGTVFMGFTLLALFAVPRTEATT